MKHVMGENAMKFNNPENTLTLIKRICRWMVALPVMAMVMALSVFILEGFPYPGRYGLPHSSLLSILLSPGLYFFDVLYLLVLLFFATTFIPMGILLWNRSLRKIHFALRFGVLARFVLYAWVMFFASRLMLSSYHGVLYMPEVLLRNFMFGGILLGAFFYIKRKYVEKPELMFP